MKRDLGQQLEDIQEELRRLKARERSKTTERAVALRWLGRSVAAAAVLLAGVPLVSSALDDLPQVASGDQLTAQMWNDNFQQLVDAVTTLEEGTQRVRGEFCGEAADTTGNIGGYAIADSMCGGVPTCEATTAHMCTAAEVQRMQASGISVPVGWYATGVWGERDNGDDVSDCVGYTSAAAPDYGAVWSGGAPSSSRCNANQSIVCCETESG